MILKNILLVLASIFLAKYAAGSDCSLIQIGDLYSRSSLGFYGNEIYKCFAINTIYNGQRVMINVREELSTMHHKSTKMRELSADIAAFLSEYKNWARTKDVQARFKLMNQAFDALIKLVNKYDAALMATPTEEDKQVSQLLERNSLDVFDQIYLEDLELLSGQITKAIQSYMKNNPPNEDTLKNWFERFQNAPSLQRRWEIFTTFFEMFVMRFSFEKGDLNSPPVSFRVVNKMSIK